MTDTPSTEAGRRLLPVIENMADAAGPAWSPAEGSLQRSILAIEEQARKEYEEAGQAVQDDGLDVERVARVIHSMEHAQWGTYETCPYIRSDRASATMFVNRYRAAPPLPEPER